MLLAGWPVRRPRDRLENPACPGTGHRIEMCVTACYKDMNRYRLDDFIEYTLSKRGRENVALAVLAASCVAGIVVIGRL